MTTTAVTVGTRFRSVIADENVLFEATRYIRGGVWMCTAVDEPYEINGRTYPSDHAGVEQPFKSSYILASVRQAEAFERSMDANADWWAAQPVGSVVHYDNSFGQFVRGIIVVDDQFRHVMRPTALVGNIVRRDATVEQRRAGGWAEWELYRVLDDGTISYGHHADKVIAGNTFAPNQSCMVESPRYRAKPNDPDPRTLEPIDFVDMAQAAAVEQMRTTPASVHKLRLIARLADNEADADVQLARIRQLLDS